MDMVSPILDVASRLWNLVSRHASYITHLEETVTSLRMKKNELIDIRDNVMLNVQQTEDRGMTRKNRVEGWLKNVEETENKANEILLTYEEISANGSTCLKIYRCRSSYKLGKNSKKLPIVIQELINNGEFPEVANPTKETIGLRDIPMTTQNPVGIQSNLERVLEALKDDDVGIIGLYGMGGVGKTTLLQKINNQLPRIGDDTFDFAFWVVASSNATIQTLQETLMETSGISSDGNKTVDEASTVIYSKLKNRKYILMLDDLWEMVDLYGKVGIPKPDSENKSKIIFTTRKQSVCSQMQAEPIRVDCLPWEEAWSLFKENVGKVTLNAQIKNYAEELAMECGGLPLALITVGRAMSGKKYPYEWSYALHQLQTCPSEFEGLEEKVFRVLQFSYDYLGDLSKQKCFLFCSLFPEDWEINVNKLVDLWMGEGYLGKHHEIRVARDYGYSIIIDLKRACLLEGVQDNPVNESVKMHDVIREMALRITKKKFLHLGMAELMSIQQDYENWNEDVEKMWLFAISSDEEVILTREFPKLSTILLAYAPRTSPRAVCFKYTPQLKVLQLSNESPERLLSLKEISSLENLEYLDIRRMRVKRFPKEMKSLRKLKYLIMDYIEILDPEECPSEIVSGLTELLVFRMNDKPSSKELLRVLENLRNIQEIGIYLDSADNMNFLLNSVKLQLCTRRMRITYDEEVLIVCPTNLRNLEFLYINESKIKALKCPDPTSLNVFKCLNHVIVHSCNCLVELDILAYAPALKYLTVMHCESLQRIVRTEEVNHVFLSLHLLELYNLPSLEYICNMPLTFPTLEQLFIVGCRKLKQNPFNGMDPNSSNLRNILIDKQFCDSLVWRDDELRNQISTFFKKSMLMAGVPY